MTKDRLEEMKKVMKDGEGERYEESSPKEKPSPLITFFEHARAIKLEIEELKSRVDGLKILLNDNQQWTNGYLRKELEHKIEEEKLIIGNLAKTIRNNLKSINNTPWKGQPTSVIQRIRDVQINTILSDLNEVLRDYLNCLVQHRERSVKILKDMMEIKGEEATDVDALLEEGKIAIFTNNKSTKLVVCSAKTKLIQPKFLKMQLQKSLRGWAAPPNRLLIGDMEEKYNLREAENRHREITKIESSILEIRNLFNELALIVDIQADKVEVVEKLVENNLAKVESGKKKLTSASKKRRKLRYRKVMIALICGGIILIVLVLLTIF